MKKITPETFVETWQKSATLNGAAKACGLTRSAAATRASAYRKRGVLLKKMPSTRWARRLCVGKLNTLIKKLG